MGCLDIFNTFMLSFMTAPYSASAFRLTEISCIIYNYGADNQVPKGKNSTTNQFLQTSFVNLEGKALIFPTEEQLCCCHSVEGVSQGAWNTQMSFGTT